MKTALSPTWILAAIRHARAHTIYLMCPCLHCIHGNRQANARARAHSAKRKADWKRRHMAHRPNLFV